jgi:hypothetical protein
MGWTALVFAAPSLVAKSPLHLLTQLGVIGGGRLTGPILPVHPAPVQTKVVLCCGFEDGQNLPFHGRSVEVIQCQRASTFVRICSFRSGKMT